MLCVVASRQRRGLSSSACEFAVLQTVTSCVKRYDASENLKYELISTYVFALLISAYLNVKVKVKVSVDLYSVLS